MPDHPSDRRSTPAASSNRGRFRNSWRMLAIFPMLLLIGAIVAILQSYSQFGPAGILNLDDLKQTFFGQVATAYFLPALFAFLAAVPVIFTTTDGLNRRQQAAEREHQRQLNLATQRREAEERGITLPSIPAITGERRTVHE